MTDAIQVEGIGKRYPLGRREPYETLRAVVAGLGRRRRSSPRDVLWALRDVSFSVKGGDVVGIIGRNGAGKSTLLKILARITRPTEGRAVLRGRVGSLLEVGSGFHPELTGRENIYLNGAVLGMRRAEVARRFDEIVAFSELERFLETPLKHYSSGMHMRLAFAVAAHLEPEILLVDEVLAVGDLAFQRKCLAKIEDVVHERRTVLFVSHNLAAIQRLCPQALLLGDGALVEIGPTPLVVERYLRDGSGTALAWTRTRPPAASAAIERVFVCDAAGQPVSYVTSADTLRVGVEWRLAERVPRVQLSVGLLDAGGDQIFGSCPEDAGEPCPESPGRFLAVMTLPPDILMPRPYRIRVALWQPSGGVLDAVDALGFTVQEAASFSNEAPGGRLGLLAIRCAWVVEHR
jgi:lipopolysaccharide transport system ATP-binding protein